MLHIFMTCPNMVMCLTAVLGTSTSLILWRYERHIARESAAGVYTVQNTLISKQYTQCILLLRTKNSFTSCKATLHLLSYISRGGGGGASLCPVLTTSFPPVYSSITNRNKTIVFVKNPSQDGSQYCLYYCNTAS